MQPAKLIIPGSYYDSQIYSGYLYLWTTAGSLLKIDWNELLTSIEIEERLNLAMNCAFRRSEYMYGNRWQLFFQNREVREVISSQFEALSHSTFELTEEQLHRHAAEVDNPFPFPHSDTAIYLSNLFVAGPHGIHFTSLDIFPQEFVSRLWEGATLGIAAGSSRLAIAAGDEGAWQTNIAPSPDQNVSQVIQQHSNFVRWLRINLFSASQLANSFLAEFRTVPRKNGEHTNNPPKRELREVVAASRLFDSDIERNHAQVWGAGDRCCMLRGRSLEVVKWRPQGKYGDKFGRIGAIELPRAYGKEIVGADNAVFGFVIELPQGLLVIDSTSQYWPIEGEPVNWRVFPRSLYYSNQLHVISDDHLTIYSFNGDYFVDQKSKLIGTEANPRRDILSNKAKPERP